MMPGSPGCFSPRTLTSSSVRGEGDAPDARRERHAATNSSTSSGVAGESSSKSQVARERRPPRTVDSLRR